jgi:hypothetical protein
MLKAPYSSEFGFLSISSPSMAVEPASKWQNRCDAVQPADPTADSAESSATRPFQHASNALGQADSVLATKRFLVCEATATIST